MRVALLPDPVQYERPGGLRTQVRETMDALTRQGIDAFLLAPGAAPRGGCDLLHVFGTGSGNAALAETATARMPVVLSPRISPGWNSADGTRARVGDRVLGNHAHWDFDTGYAQMRRALRSVRLVVAQAEAERKSICRAFLVPPERVCLVGSGIGERFFRAEPTLFRARLRLDGPFALMVGQVSPWHGQLEVARQLAELGLPLVAIGEVQERDADYLRALRSLRTVHCVESLAHDDPLLASSYAAATFVVLPSHGGAVPMAALEALAAGTPVVADWPLEEWSGAHGVFQVERDAPGALALVAAALRDQPLARDDVRAAVLGQTWDRLTGQLVDYYRAVLSEPF
jgi:glycosyltransferase involved in cell wall biosynthesis